MTRIVSTTRCIWTPVGSASVCARIDEPSRQLKLAPARHDVTVEAALVFTPEA
jgi:hypothetical protein